MAYTVRSVIFDVIGRDNASRAFLSASKGAEMAATRMDRATYRMQMFGARMASAGKTMTKGITLPIIAAVGIAIDQAAKYQKSMVLLQTATGELDKNMGTVSRGILKISEATGTSASQLASGMYLAEKAGYRGGAGLKVLGVAAKGAKAENVDLSVAMSALTSIMKSYQLGADKATYAENALIRGSGRAKATMTDFAGSLSNVVPLAAALGIKLPEVLAAVATMTQHGETAQRSTENLANLLSNLSGANAVATQGMQQLDINVVNLQRHLGDRGLLGTLQLVLNKLRAHGKAGVIVYDSFKKAALGTASLQTMLGKMSGGLKKASEAFLHNKEGLKQYRTYVREFGGTQAAMGTQFLQAVQSAKGFNNLLRSGRGDVQTYAKALQGLFGMTGLKTVLMLLGGESMKNNKGVNQFKSIAADITRAAGTKGVLGWSKTAKTASVQFDKLKASLQVLAIEMGTHLLPIAVKVAHAIEGLVHWFDNLSSGQRKILGWALAVGALLGPMLAILGRLTRGFVILWRVGLVSFRFLAGMRQAELAMDSMGTAAYKNGLKVGASMLRVRLAIAGVGLGIGLLAGSLAHGASTTNKWATVIGSAGAGAAVGWSMGGGPWGAAIGGLTAGISSLVMAFRHTGSAAAAEQQRVAAYFQTIQSYAQQATDTVEALTAAIEADSGAIGRNARAQIASDLTKRGVPGVGKGVMPAAISLGIRPDEFVKAAMGNQKDLAKVQWMTTYGGGLPQLQNTTLAQRKAVLLVTQALAVETRHLREAAAAADLDALANGSLNLSSRSVAREAARVGTALTGQSAAAAVNKQFITDHIEATRKWADKQVEAGKSITSVEKAVRSSLREFKANMAAAGYSSVVVDQIVARFHNLSRAVLIKDKIQAVRNAIDNLRRGLKLGKLDMSNDAARARISELQTMLHDLQAQIDGLNGTQITIGANISDLLGKLQNGKITQAQFDAAYRSQATKVGITVSGGGGAVGGGGGGGGRIGGSPPPAGGGSTGGGGSSATSALDALKTLLDAARTFDSTAYTFSSTAADLASAATAMRQAAAAAKVSAQVQTDLARQQRTLTKLGRERDSIDNRLGTPPSRPTAYDRLGTARDAYNGAITNTRNAFTGAVDITTMGQNSWGVASAGGIVGSIMKLAKDATKFARIVKRLAKEGLPQALVEQLANAGPGALGAAEALAAATPKQMRQIKTAYNQIKLAGGAHGLGGAIAKDYYLAGLQSAEAYVKALKDKRSMLTKAIRGLSQEMVRELYRELGRTPPHMGKGHYGAGERKLEQHFNVYGITDPEAFAKAVARRLAQLVA